jgi:hypothetical protein
VINKILLLLIPFLILTGCGSKFKKIYSNENSSSLEQGRALPFSFEIYKQTEIAKIRTYHWNNGKGKNPGQIVITDKKNKLIGSWQANSVPGKNNSENVLWEVTPDISLPPGKYLISTSDQKSWSFNKTSLGSGFTSIYTKE